MMWLKGVTHYHTSFNYPPGQRISPEKLLADFEKLKISFAFCAGDHGNAEGDNYWGLDVREFKEYKALCRSFNREASVILIPAPEIHIMFPPFDRRHEHHCCVPILNYLPDLEVPESKILAASYTKRPELFISEAHRHNASLVLNHPYQSCSGKFKGPAPLLEDTFLYQFDYMELLTIDWPGNFHHDFNLYLDFLSHRFSAMMGCCAGIDNASAPCKLLSNEKRILPITWLYASSITEEAILSAYNNRNSYITYGDMGLSEIDPVPSKYFIPVKRYPEISLIMNDTYRQAHKLEIYRNGCKVFEKRLVPGECSFHWIDKTPEIKRNHYIVHIEVKEQHLVTSPINYCIE